MILGYVDDGSVTGYCVYGGGHGGVLQYVLVFFLSGYWFRDVGDVLRGVSAVQEGENCSRRCLTVRVNVGRTKFDLVVSNRHRLGCGALLRVTGTLRVSMVSIVAFPSGCIVTGKGKASARTILRVGLSDSGGSRVLGVIFKRRVTRLLGSG